MALNKYLLDTKAAISLLTGNNVLEKILEQAEWVGISVISIIEFFAFTQLAEEDKCLFLRLLEKIESVNLSMDINGLEEIGKLKIRSNLKVPDTIIASYAIQNNVTLVTNDKDFNKVHNLQILTF